jgi:hypothetical protein
MRGCMIVLLHHQIMPKCSEWAIFGRRSYRWTFLRPRFTMHTYADGRRTLSQNFNRHHPEKMTWDQLFLLPFIGFNSTQGNYWITQKRNVTYKARSYSLYVSGYTCMFFWDNRRWSCKCTSYINLWKLTSKPGHLSSAFFERWRNATVKTGIASDYDEIHRHVRLLNPIRNAFRLFLLFKLQTHASMHHDLQRSIYRCHAEEHSLMITDLQQEKMHSTVNAEQMTRTW